MKSKQVNANSPRVVTRELNRLSPWASVMTRTLVSSGKSEPEIYHSLQQADYVSVFAMTPDGRIPLVRQYRSALERYTLELPGGLRDGDESPEVCALRELYEETGLTANGAPMVLGCLAPDTGRLENNLWGYAVRVSGDVASNWQPELGIEPIWTTKTDLRKWLLSGEFNHALHIALIGMAQLHGFFEWS
jgi:8-oxo-dGTP pyrophosphatase MutT (NUDIX family)